MAQSNSEAEAVRVWFRLLRLNSRLHVAMAERLKGLGLSVSQCDVLSTLTEREGVTQRELAEHLYVTKGNISGLIDRLAAAGFVERRSMKNDRRSHAIYLTPAGRASAQAGIIAQRRFVAETLGQLTAVELSEFEHVLIRVRDYVRARSKIGEETKDQAGPLPTTLRT